MKTRITSLILAIASLFNATNALAYERGCTRGMVPADIGTSNLNPTFIHLVYLYPIELSMAHHWRGSLILTALMEEGCSAWGTTPPRDIAGTPAGSTGNFWSFVTGLPSQSCSGLEYSFQYVAIFDVSYEFWWVDPNDPFQIPQYYQYSGLWPAEGVPCPQGVLRGILSY